MPANIQTKTIYAHAHRSGRISFDAGPIPDGLLVMKGPEKRVRNRVEARARHAYDGKTLLVPGLPEADSEDAALRAVLNFCEFLRARPGRRGR